MNQPLTRRGVLRANPEALRRGLETFTLLLLVASLAIRNANAQAGPEIPPETPPEAKLEEQGQPDAAQPDTLGETVVIATRHEENAFDVPRAVTVVDEQDMLERGSRTAAEGLRYKPGIWVQKTGHLGGAPVIRGFMGNRVIYMFDGIRRNTAGLFAGPNSFLQNIDALDIDRIEVVRGPGSVLYGSDAIGGVINVISNEKPIFSKNSLLGGRLYSRFATADNETSSRAEGYLSTSDFYAFVGGTYRDIGDLKAGGDIGTQSPSGWREQNFDAQMNFRTGDQSSVELFMQDFSRPIGYRYDRPNWKQSNDRQLFGARFRAQEVGFMDSFEATGYYHDQEGFIDEKFWDSDSDEETVGFDLQATSFVGDDVRLVYGAHYNRDDVVKSNPQKGTEDPDVLWENPAVFVLSEWQASRKLRLDLGLRWDSFSLDSTAPEFAKLDSVLQDAINNGAFALSDLELNESDQALTGGVGAVYSLTPETNLVAHIGRAFRAPNKGDLLSFGQFSFGFGVPATTLRPESSMSYELGLRRQTGDFAGGMTAFYTEIDDAIVSAPGTFNGSDFVDVNGNTVKDPGEDVFKKTNSDGTVRALGVEFEARQYFSRGWNEKLVGDNALSWFGNASWITGEDTGSGEPLDRAYPANALVGLRLDDSRISALNGWWVELETWLVRKFDRIPSARRAKDPAFKNDPQDSSSGLIGGNGDLPGFGIVNLRGGMRLTKGVTLFVGAENLTNKGYRVKDSRIDAPGLNFIIGLNVTF